MSNYQTTNGFVALFDILGFKALRSQIGTKELINSFEKFEIILQHAESNETDFKTGKPLSNQYSTKKVGISDTIFFYRTDDKFDDFLSILLSTQRALAFSLSGYKMPLRGAIGYGDIATLTWNLFGSAVEDASRYYESQVWAGCILTSDCQEFIKRQNFLEILNTNCDTLAEQENNENKRKRILELKNILVEYQIPFQDQNKQYSYKKGLAINWPMKYLNNTLLQNSAFNYSSDKHAIDIKNNTVAFFDYVKNMK